MDVGPRDDLIPVVRNLWGLNLCHPLSKDSESYRTPTTQAGLAKPLTQLIVYYSYETLSLEDVSWQNKPLS